MIYNSFWSHVDTMMAIFIPHVFAVYTMCFGGWTCTSIHQLVNRRVARINIVGTGWNHQPDCDFALDRHQLLTRQLQGPLPFVAYVGMGQYLLIPFLVGWTSIYQLFWGSLGTRVLTHPHVLLMSLCPCQPVPPSTRWAQASWCPANDERRAAGRSTGPPLRMPDLCRWRFDGI